MLFRVGWLIWETNEKLDMTTIFLILGNIIYGFLSIMCGVNILCSEYQTVNNVIVSLFTAFVFGGFFFLAMAETIKNLKKGVWR